MSSVTSHLESRDPLDETELICRADLGSTPDDRVCVPEPESTHANLLRFAWMRQTAEQMIAGEAFEIVSKGTGRHPDKLYIKLGTAFSRDAVPWSRGPGIELVPIFGEPEKMECPTFDLPTGFMELGGSCPAAGMCQSTMPIARRERLEDAARDAGILVGPTGPSAGSYQVSLLETICSSCYAQGGNYQYANAQARLAVRYLWTIAMLRTEEGFNAWVQTMVAALAAEDFLEEAQTDPRTGEMVRPVRLHSSGDFFSPRYAKAWCAVANVYPQLSFWGPTRTWAFPGWNQHWGEILPSLAHQNLIVRPSALHFGDYAPRPGEHPWIGPYPYNAAGSTSLRHEGLGADMTPEEHQGRNFGGEYDPRYDWGCQAYARSDEASTCRHALNPGGVPGCRACWIHPDLRINYSAH